MTPAAARKLADEREETDPASAKLLRKWALNVGRGKRRAAAGMTGDSDEAWERAESHRQALADLGVEVPSRSDLEAPPASRQAAPPSKKASGGASSSGGSRSRVSPGSRPRPRPGSNVIGKAADVSGASAAVAKGGSIAGPILVGTLGLILFYRLINTAQGGPGIFSMAIGGARRAIDLVVLPVDPFKSGASSSSAASTSSSSSTAVASRSSTATH